MRHRSITMPCWASLQSWKAPISDFLPSILQKPAKTDAKARLPGRKTPGASLERLLRTRCKKEASLKLVLSKGTKVLG